MTAMSSLAYGQATQDKFFDSNGVRIRYVEQGAGEPVVLVHGYISSAEEAWFTSGVFQQLAINYRVIAMDCRGHGKSDKPHDVKQYGEEMALDIVRLLDHLKIRKAHIVGYSMGARLVGYLLVTHPGRFITATLGGSPPRVGWPSEEEARAEREAQRMEQRPKSTPADGLDYIALAAVARSRGKQIVTATQLQKITVPTIGIVGSGDPSLASMQALKPMMPALLRLTIIEGAIHAGENGALRRPEFTQTVQEFLKANSIKK